MATTGIGGYVYNEPTVKDGSVSFHFYDPEDASNTADTTVSSKDFPEGATADSRQVVDIAFDTVSKGLNDKRDARIKREAAEQLDKQLADQAVAREATADFLSNSKEQSDLDSTLNSPEATTDSNKKK